MWRCDGRVDAISFKASKAIYVHGIGMYGCYEGNSNYNVIIQLYDSQDNLIVSSNSVIIKTDQNQDIYDIMFDAPCKLKSGVFYTVVTYIKESCTKLGANVKQSIKFGDVDIHFMKSFKDQKTNGVEYGQIPGLLLSHH